MGGLVALVVVTHSRALGRAAVALADQMLTARRPPIQIAAGRDETTFGTDATAVAAAITLADLASGGEGVVVLTDLGSAVLSADLALELLDEGVRSRVALSCGPLVEGLVVAAVTAATGASRDDVARAADDALHPKRVQLGR